MWDFEDNQDVGSEAAIHSKSAGLKRATETKESEKIGRGALHAGRSSTGRSCGLHGRENAGMSSEIEVGIL